MKEKNFKQDNPALAFINTEEAEKPEKKVTASSSKAPEGYKPNPEYIETKSKRIQLLIQPSVYDALKEVSKDRDQSFNETANEALKYFLEKEGKM